MFTCPHLLQAEACSSACLCSTQVAKVCGRMKNGNFSFWQMPWELPDLNLVTAAIVETFDSIYEDETLEMQILMSKHWY